MKNDIIFQYSIRLPRQTMTLTPVFAVPVDVVEQQLARLEAQGTFPQAELELKRIIGNSR